MFVSPQFWMVSPSVVICSFAWKLPLRGWNFIGRHLLPALKGPPWLTSAEIHFFFILENCIDINNEIRFYLTHISPSNTLTRPSQQPPPQLHVFLFFFSFFFFSDNLLIPVRASMSIWWQAIHWSMGFLSVIISSKNNGSPFTSNYQLPIASR